MVILRRTDAVDLGVIAAVEADADTRLWLGDTSTAWHLAALADPDQEHLVLLETDGLAGLAVLAGLTDPSGGIELRRLVIAGHRRGRGLGSSALRAVVSRAFERGAHRIWLDVKEANRRAQALYAGEGFVSEGVLRDACAEPDGTWASLVVMSLLSTDRRAATVTALHHVLLSMPAGREAEARAFYGEILHMTEIGKPPALAARGGAWFRKGGLELHLGVEEPFAPVRKAHPGILLDLAEFDALAARLAEAGSPVQPDDAFPGYRRFYTDDAFGNRLELLTPDQPRA